MTADRPTDLVAIVEHLTFLQIDPTAAIAPSGDLVAWSPLGEGYRPEHLTREAIPGTVFRFRIETVEGRRQYAEAQRSFAERAAPLRARLIAECDRLRAIRD